MTTYNDANAGYSTEEILYNGMATPSSLLIVGDRSLDYVSGTLVLNHSYNRRCTARIRVESDLPLSFEEGEPLALYLDGKRAFRGVLLNPTASYPGPLNIEYDIDANCFHSIPSWRIISKSYQQTTVQGVVLDIIDALADEGIIPGEIAVGPIVDEIVFAYVYADKALDRLAETVDMHWHVDSFKRLSFGPIDQFAAPYALTSIDGYASQFKSSVGNRDYRNRQFIKGGKAETLERTEQWVGDGVQTTFVTGFPIARQPVVTVDTVVQTVDVRGIGDPNAQWFWSYGSTELTQNDAGTPVAAPDVIEITYKGLFDLVAVSRDNQEIALRQQRQRFGTGIIDNVEVDTTILTSDAAFQTASGLLSRYGIQGRKVSWDTEDDQLGPGMFIEVNLPGQDVVGTFFITDIEIRDISGRTVRSVQATEGPNDGDWASWFGRKLSIPTQISFRENIGEEESLIILEDVQENWHWDETIDTTTLSCFLVGAASVDSASVC